MTMMIFDDILFRIGNVVVWFSFSKAIPGPGLSIGLARLSFLYKGIIIIKG